MKSQLKKDLDSFLERYYNFELIDSKNENVIVIVGVIDIVDEADIHWGSYKIKIAFNKNDYPNVIPSVFELSDLINRNWDYHISKKGKCCLDIPHQLFKLRTRGIELSDFYKNVIYPFFSNHQYKLKSGKYANGEYEHFESGIVQFYREEFGLIDPKIIIKHLELALVKRKAEPNLACPICGKLKYKKCCRPKVYKLIPFGYEQLQFDLELFKKRLDSVS